jgi:protein O-GlcNAc transferase
MSDNRAANQLSHGSVTVPDMATLTRAIELFRQGAFDAAERACESQLAGSTESIDALNLLAEIRVASGRPAAAIPVLTRLTQLRPEDAAVQRRLGAALLTQGSFTEAVAALRTAIALDPHNTRAYNNLGQALMRVGEIDAAIASYRESLRRDPEYAIAHVNLALALEASDQLPESLLAYEQAIALVPHLVEPLIGRASALANLQRFDAALDSLDAALRRAPDHVDALIRKASVLLSLERADDSLHYANQALQRRGQSAEAHNIRAGALRRLNRHTEALSALDQSLRIESGDVEVWCNRGVVCHELGDTAGAVASYRQALELNPGCLRARTRLVGAQLPPVPADPQEWLAARTHFATELAALESWFAGNSLSDADAMLAARQQFFYLSYDEQSNRELLERYRGLCSARLAPLYGTAPRANSGRAVAADRPNNADRPHNAGGPARRFKLGFVSAHVFDHSVYHAILRGWLRELDRSAFEISVFNVALKQDVWTDSARDSAEHFVNGSRTLPEWVDAIRSADLDALIYPEIGMNEATLGLASLRLAPRQMASWGHPETSGLPTIDDFLSADALEPSDGADHYSERLVRLPNLGVAYEPYGETPMPVDPASFGIGAGPIFICAGVPFKYRAEDDFVLVELARRLDSAQFVFFQHERAQLSERLKARLTTAFAGAGLDPLRHLLWIPWLPRPAFRSLMSQADVYLDTLGFSGFNTLMQAVEANLPCVSLEGRFLRGRLGSGILRQLGLNDLVASSRSQYIEIAASLAADARGRSTIQERMRLREASIYADRSAVAALASHLLNQTQGTH